jgi:hypothetical protein
VGQIAAQEIEDFYHGNLLRGFLQSPRESFYVMLAGGAKLNPEGASLQSRGYAQTDLWMKFQPPYFTLNGVFDPGQPGKSKAANFFLDPF